MNIFTQFVNSMYSPKAMASYRFQGIGKTILYVFFLVLITSIPLFINLGTGATNFYTTTQTILKSETPDFYIEDGTFYADVEEPVVVKKEGITIIIDPGNKLSLSEIENYTEVAAIQRKEIIFKFEGTQQFIPLADFQDTYIGKEELISFMESQKPNLPIYITLIIIGAYIFFSSTTFIQITILGLIGLVLKNSLNRNNLQFRHTWILAAYAVTVPSIIFAVLHSLQIKVPGAMWVNFGLAVIVLFLIIKEVKVRKSNN